MLVTGIFHHAMLVKNSGENETKNWRWKFEIVSKTYCCHRYFPQNNVSSFLFYVKGLKKVADSAMFQ